MAASNSMWLFAPSVPRTLLPWEIGVAGEVFGATEAVWPMSAAHLVGPDAGAADPPARTVEEAIAIAVGAARAAAGRPDDEARELRLRQWRVVAELLGAGCQLGRDLECTETELDAEELVRNVFAEKATNTLARRGSSMMLYLKWARVANPSLDEAFSETRIYAYVEELRRNGAPATKARSAMEAIFFAKGTLGVHIGDEVAASARIRGAIARAWESKRLTKKAPPLSVGAVAVLEHAACAGEPLERVVAGFLCFLIHARGRCSDVARISKEPVLEGGTDGFVEVVADAVKGSRGKKRRRLGLPVVAPRRGVSNAPWAEGWLEARSALGLDASSGGLLMPAVGWGGSLAESTAMSAPQATEYLRRFVPPPPEGALPPTSHSCTATVLSWLAKAGSRLEDRRLLGGHARPGDRTVLEYSRDALAGPLRVVTQLYARIRCGDFAPDATRSGRWKCDGGPSEGSGGSMAPGVSAPSESAPPRPVDAAPVARATPVVETDDESSVQASEDESGSEDGPDGSDDEDPEAMVALEQLSAGRVQGDVVPEGYATYYHARTLTKHLKAVGGELEVFECGRLATPAFKEGGGTVQPICRQCLASVRR